MVATNRERIIDAVTLQLEELFTEMDAVKLSHYLTYSRGNSLDSLGILLNTLRLYEELDSIYRNRLLQVISINGAAGTKSALKLHISTYLNIDSNLISIEENIASSNTVYVRIPDTYIARKEELRAELHRVSAAGIFVRFIFEDNNWDEADWDDADYTWGN